MSKVTLDTYSNINAQIIELQNQNNKFEQLDALKKDFSTKNASMSEAVMTQAGTLQTKLNNKMVEINSFIFNENYNAPEFHVASPKSYTFNTPYDDGAGTNYKGMIVMDLATLDLTPLPLLVHDSDMLKKISDENVEKIFELYLKSVNKYLFL